MSTTANREAKRSAGEVVSNDLGQARSAKQGQSAKQSRSGKQTLTPKQAEIRNREAKIIELARPMVARGGLAGLSMEAIAREMSYAKGTIYNHFSCKEEILLALAIGANNKRLELFVNAVEAMETPRDKISAIGVACQEFRIRFEDLFFIDSLVRHSTVWEKASEQRREAMAMCEQYCMSVVAGVGQEAVQCGDLVVADATPVEDIMFGLWSLTYGGMIIDGSSPGLDSVGVQDAFVAIRRNCHALMDGYRWRPLYEPVRDRKLIDQVRDRLNRCVGPELVVNLDVSELDPAKGAFSMTLDELRRRMSEVVTSDTGESQ
ncbi:TetR/AcrR family transcriptional regulator [Roseiconus lacunae]|uniref:TetR/AcrR family transcriptional regulator n=1 Tax=Roseiconus lacunae TaxID=2605694 RepID=UPI0011F198FB|nr:TetR/AcrR family transcriptional regulator [Roseiconus lacunae]MCD0459769.1 TetR/AcrR family transcriptional regulator [Roseiconus lacunae]